MSQPIEPIHHKLTEAIPPPAEIKAEEHGAEGVHPPTKAGMKEHNATVQPGTKDHMVDIGRGEQTKGRGAQ
jgi:hypothetical protein